MADFIEENIRTEMIDLDDLPNSLIFSIPKNEYNYTPELFGINEHLHIQYYERRFERIFPGLLNQFPCLYYMVEEMMEKATQLTPLEEIELKKQG